MQVHNCITFDLEYTVLYLSPRVCISCNLENVTFVEGGVLVHNAIGITVMKNLTVVVHQTMCLPIWSLDFLL